MNVVKFSCAIAALVLSTLAQSSSIEGGIVQQPDTAIEMHLTNPPSAKPNYHDYAVAQAQARWGIKTAFNPEQHHAIREIENYYAALDNTYREQLRKNQDRRLQDLLNAPNSVAYIKHLNEFYATDMGKQILLKQPIFKANQTALLDNLPSLVSKKILAIPPAQSDLGHNKP